MKEIQKVLLVVNPVSGNLNKKGIIQTIENELLKINTQTVIYQTTGKNDSDKIRKLVIENKFDRVFIAGGDGTVKQVAEALVELLIPIAIFPAGSANGLAVNLAIPNNLEDQLKIAMGSNLNNS